MIVAVSCAATVTAPVPVVTAALVIDAAAPPWTLLTTTSPPMARAAAFCGVAVGWGLFFEGSPTGRGVVGSVEAGAGWVGVVVVPGMTKPSGMKFESRARFHSVLSL
ncbi:hypothetical protein CHKEEEPN_1635 [Methylorubrum podarium]|nr:hypothetical protein CHKEEEPN_1635 [Methylorubrum podarium]